MIMLLSERDLEWQPLPPWMNFLIQMGYGWRRAPTGPRRIALVSMPCDSAAAGLITLGALLRDLSVPDANDVDGHYDKLLQYARQFLKSCKDCNLVCYPILKQCGYAKRATGKLRSPLLPHKIVEISERTNQEKRELVWIQASGKGRCFVTPHPDHAKHYHIEDEPPVIWSDTTEALDGEIFQALVAGAQILAENLLRSYSGLCLAGRGTGESASRNAYSQIKFQHGAHENTLEQLLTIHGWSNCPISRMSFFNPRTGRIDRDAATPHLVVADGDTSLLKVADRTEFQQSDLLGVIHRTMERDRLEAVGARMIAWQQWYDCDEEMLYSLPPVPRGISISILKRRA